MIEVLFSESEATTMRILKENKKNGQFLENKEFFGTKEEVICLAFMLDIGDISQPVESDYRYELIQSLYFQNQWKDDEDDEEFEDNKNIYLQELNLFKDFLHKGEKIRIWYSDAPYSRCGLYWLCSLLENIDNEKYIVKLPEYFVLKDGIASYENWNEASEEHFLECLAYEKKLTKQDILYFTRQWDELVNNHSLLRAFVNGKMIGVPEDFYDFQIWKHLKNELIMEANLIGKIMLDYQNSVADWWYARRIEYYIQQKKIKVIKDSKSKYERMICLNENKKLNANEI